MTVTFCGHRDTQDAPELRAWLTGCVEKLVAEGADTFYLGDYGGFDRLAASVVWQVKQKVSYVESVHVLAYLGQRADVYGFDRTMYPEIEDGPLRFAIVRRNRWMVDHSDVLVACVILDSGGAAEMRRYARRKISGS